jgi:hypothetical protein
VPDGYIGRVAVLESVNLARVISSPDWNDGDATGIDKRPAHGPVSTGANVLVGDTICDTTDHGGPDQAVYAYAREDAAWWAGQLGREVTPGAFGENFSTSGLDVTGAVIGERWAIGSAVFEVSCPRIPCRTFAGFWDVPRLVKWFTARCRLVWRSRSCTVRRMGSPSPRRSGRSPGIERWCPGCCRRRNCRPGPRQRCAGGSRRQGT